MQTKLLFSNSNFFGMKKLLLTGLFLCLAMIGFGQLPRITDFNPKTGTTGTSVTITGSNFNTTLANNSVFLNGAKCNVTAATATSLTVTIPAQVAFGAFYYANTANGYGCLSPQKFLPRPMFPDPGVPRFVQFPFSVSTANSGNSATAHYYGLADINTDGRLDVFQYNGQGSPRGNMILNNSTSQNFTTGSFARTQIAPPVINNQWDINQTYTADFNNDGNMDFYCGIGGYQPGFVNINTTPSGSATPTLANFVATGTNSMTQSDRYYYHIADVDWDGDLDMVSFSGQGFQHSKNNSILNGTKQTNISFQPKGNVNSVPNSGLSVSNPKTGLVADLNNDQRPDFITLGGSTISFIRNTTGQNQDGQFWSFVQDDLEPLVGSNRTGGDLVDIDGDGDLDLVVANSLAGNGAISVYYNQTAATTGATLVFGARQDISVSTSIYGLSIYDFNGDGKPDILARSVTASTGFVYIQNTSTTTTTATFASPIEIGGNDGNTYPLFQIADLNLDGLPDIVTSTGSGVTFFKYFDNIQVSGSVSTFNGCYGANSVAQSLTVTAKGLTQNLVITAPAGMEISLNSGSGYASSLTLTQSGGNVASTQVWIRTTTTALVSPGNSGIMNFTSGTMTKSAVLWMVIRSVPTVNSVTGATRCGAGSVTLSASVNTGDATWFTASSGGSAVFTGPSFTTPSLTAPTTYFVEANNGGCVSTSRSSVVATVNFSAITAPTSVVIGTNYTLTGAGTPAPSNPWVSTNPSVATINSSGVLTPVGVGSVTINYTSTTGCGSQTIFVDANTYYAKSSGASNLFSLSNWSSNLTGTGPSPTGFRPGITYILNNSANTASFSFGSNVIMDGNLVIPSGKTLSLPSYSSVSMNGNVANDGSITALIGSNLTFGGTTQSVTGNGNWNVVNLTNNANLSLTNDMVVTGSFANNGGKTVEIVGNKSIQISGSSITLSGQIRGSGLLTLNGVNQNISSSNGRVGRLVVNSNTTLNLGNTLFVDSSFQLLAGKTFYISPYAVSSTTTLQILGSYSNLGNIIAYGFNQSGFNGGGVLSLTGTGNVELGSGTFYTLMLPTNGGKVTCSQNTTINGNLVLGLNRQLEITSGRLLTMLGNITNDGAIMGLGTISMNNTSVAQSITGTSGSTVSRFVINSSFFFNGINTITDSLVLNTGRSAMLAANSYTNVLNHCQIGGNFSTGANSTLHLKNQTMANFGGSVASSFANLIIDSLSVGVTFQSTVPAASIFSSLVNRSSISFNNGFNCGQVGNPFTFRGNGTFPKVVCNSSIGALVNIFDSPLFTSDFNAGSRKVILNGGKFTVMGAISNVDGNQPIVTGNAGVYTQLIGNGVAHTAHIGNTSNSGDYYPVILTNNSGASDEFSFTIRNNAFQNGSSGSNGNGVIPRTWVVSKKTANGGTGVNLSFTHLSSDSLVATFTRKVLFRFDGANWVQVPGAFINTAINTRTLTINNYTGELNNTLFAIGDSATGFVRTKFYPVAGQHGNLNSLSSWRSNQNGTGSTPTTFGENCEFVLSDNANTNTFSLNGNWELKGKLSIPSGKTLNLGNNVTLNLSGDLSNSGDLVSGSNSKLVLNGQSNQSINGNVQLTNLDITSGKKVSLLGNIQVSNQINLLNASSLETFSTSTLTARIQGGVGTEFKISGSTNQTFNGSINVGKITVNNPQSAQLNGQVSTNEVSFSQGKLNIGNQNFFANSFNGANNNSYIAVKGLGKVNTLIGTGATTLIPVGGDQYSPVTITNNNAAADTFGIGVMDSVVKYGQSGSSINAQRNRVNQTWMISKKNPNVGGVNMTFQWNSAKVVGTLTNPTLFRYADTAWNLNQSGTTTSTSQSLTVTNFTEDLTSPFVIVDGATPLPVTWVSFQGKWKAEQTVLLQWVTAMEKNVSHFEVEKLSNNKQFEVIGTTSAKGSSVQNQNYTFEDRSAVGSNLVYRVTAVDFDGSRNSSALVVLNSQKSNLSVFPNPCADVLTVQTEKGSEIEIFNVEGKLIQRFVSNQNQMEIDLSSYQAGVYFLKSNGNNQNHTMKFLKK